MLNQIVRRITRITVMLVICQLEILKSSTIHAFTMRTTNVGSSGKYFSGFTNFAHIYRSKSTSLLTSSSLSTEEETTREDSNSSVQVSVDDDDLQHANFLANCKVLCEQRNLKLTKVKNARDLASSAGSTIRPNRLYRMGRVSDATQADIQLLLHDLQIRTLIDLRSPTEWKDDPTLLRPEVFANFTNLLWKERRSGKGGCLQKLLAGQSPVKSKKNPFRKEKHMASVDHNSEHLASLSKSEEDELAKIEVALMEDKAILVTENDALIFEEECTLDCEEENTSPTSSIPSGNQQQQTGGKERYFISLMNEFKYVRGTVSKVRKRDITKAIIKAPGAVFSKRVRSSLKKPFLDEINGGGLPMLNELLLRFGAPGIRYVLELCSDTSKHPVAFYCTAGKDRTGIIAAIILSLCGVPDESIVEDYTLSANVYAEMNDHQAMVGALSQRSLDAKTFLGAPAHVMRDTLATIREQYGSVEGYCSYIGFTPQQQQQLRDACTK